MATLSSHKSPAIKTAAAEPSTEVSTALSKKEPARTSSSPSLRSDTVSISVTPVKPTKPVTPTPTPKKEVKVTQATYFVSVDGCLHPLS